MRRGERAKMEAWFPHFNIRMGCELGRTCMLIYMVALANAATSPIILPFALWWFLIGWIFWRYSILYVFERSTESGGMVSFPVSVVTRRDSHPRGGRPVGRNSARAHRAQQVSKSDVECARHSSLGLL